jgi:hypothetical protein
MRQVLIADRDHEETAMMTTTLTAYCATCRASREIRDWREHADSLFIELEECGHVIRRCARDEWRLEKAVA